MINPQQVVNAARACVGTPFRHQGSDGLGMDCAGLLIAVARKLGLNHPAALAYPALPPMGLFDQLLLEYCWPVSEPEVGGVVRLFVSRRAQHLAICGDYPHSGMTLIHSFMTAGRVTEHRLDDRWLRRIVSCWRIKGVH